MFPPPPPPPERRVSPLPPPRLPVVPTPTTQAVRWSLSTVVSAPAVVPGFALTQQARHGFAPNRVRAPSDRRFASGCSPPRLAATQLPSATKLRHALAGTPTPQTRRPRGRTGRRGSVVQAQRQIH